MLTKIAKRGGEREGEQLGGELLWQVLFLWECEADAGLPL